MAMSVDDMKDTFMCGYPENTQKMLAFIQGKLGIKDYAIWNYIGYYVVSVDPKEYEHVLVEGKKFAYQEDLGMYWLNNYNVRRSPIASYDIGFAILPKKLIPGENEEGKSNRSFWETDYENRTPQVILDYFENMREYLKVQKIFRTFTSSDEDGLIITPLSIYYNTEMELLKEFVGKNGYGPFKEIRPMSITGEIQKEPIPILKMK